MNNLQTLTSKQLVNSVDAYIRSVHKIPLLTPEEEFDLAARLQETGDIMAAQKLVLAHLRFVVRIAKAYSSYGLALSDLIQEGNIGLMKAVKKFDPHVGVRLVSFAVHWIKAEIQEYVLRNWRIVKVATTKSLRKLFFNLRKAKKKLTWLNQEEIEAVAKELNVDPAEVREMEARLSGHDTSFDVAQENEDEEHDHHVAPVLYLEDQRYDPARQIELHDQNEQGNEKLQSALVTLDPRSQHILTQRWLAEPKATLQELAAHYQVSAERIRQLEQNAMKKLKTAIGSI